MMLVGQSIGAGIGAGIGIGSFQAKRCNAV